MRNLQYIAKGFDIQKNVIRALIYRELKTRVSKARFGVLGILIEPLISLGIFILIFAFFRIRQTYGLDIVLFLGTGFILFRSFQSIITSSIYALEANNSLFYYQQVKPLDTVIARTIVEAFLNFIIYLILFSISFLIKGTFRIDNFPLLFTSYFFLILYSLSVGIILMVASSRYQWVKIVVPFLSRPLFFTSGVLFSINRIPQNLYPFLTWNPILHSIETARHALSNDYILNDQISILFVLKTSLITLTLSLFVYKNNFKLLTGK